MKFKLRRDFILHKNKGIKKTFFIKRYFIIILIKVTKHF